MEHEKSLRLLLRQLKDIQAQADKIQTGENSNASLENFARYSSELKEYILKNIDSPEIKAYLKELPEINYSRMEIKLWQYLLFPSWWLDFYKDYHARNKTIDEIGHARSKYATLELLVKGYTN